MVLHLGGCHCGAVKWQAEAPSELTVVHCKLVAVDPNDCTARSILCFSCSICRKKQNHHVIVPAANFQLLTDESQLTLYTFNTGAARHLFCRHCGVQSFYRPRSNPDGVGIMPHCIDSVTVRALTRLDYDGQNWEQEAATDNGCLVKNMSRSS